MSSTPRAPAHGRYLLGLIAVSVVLRVAVAFYFGNDIENLPGTADQLSYHTLALRVLEGHGFSFGEPWWPATAAGAPTAHWSYFYTHYLVAVYGLFGPVPLIARLLQAVIVGVLQPWLVYQIGRRIYSPSVGLAGAALMAGYAYFIYYAAALMTESFYICAILGLLVLIQRLAAPPAALTRSQSLALAVGLGVTLGAAVLLRQLILFFVPVLFGWAGWVAWRRGQLRVSLLRLALAGGVMVAMILPFSFYNYARFGQWVLLNTNSGFAFFLANHPIYGTTFQPILSPETGSYGDLIPKELSHLNEAQLDQELLKRGLQFVFDDLGRYVLLSFSRIPAYFMFWPSRDSSLISNLSRVASFGLLWPLMLYGLIQTGWTYLRRQPEHTEAVVLLVLFGLCYTGIHLLSWALIRYRLPVDAVLLVFAGFGLVDLVGRVRRGRAVPQPA